MLSFWKLTLYLNKIIQKPSPLILQTSSFDFLAPTSVTPLFRYLLNNCKLHPACNFDFYSILLIEYFGIREVLVY